MAVLLNCCDRRIFAFYRYPHPRCSGCGSNIKLRRRILCNGHVGAFVGRYQCQVGMVEYCGVQSVSKVRVTAVAHGLVSSLQERAPNELAAVRDQRPACCSFRIPSDLLFVNSKGGLQKVNLLNPSKLIGEGPQPNSGGKLHFLSEMQSVICAT